MMHNKKAELTTTQIVMITVLIASFAIILFFIFRLNLEGTTTEQICHNSVVQRSNSLISSTGTVPLNCKPRYICISSNSKCTNSRMPKPDEVMIVKNKQDLFKVIAEEMATCWWMYGEGEIDYLGQSDAITNKYCSICSNIVFDKSIKEKILTEGYFTEKEMNDYLVNTDMPGKKEMTYAEYFYRVKISKGTDLSIKNSTSGELLRPSSIDISPEKQYYIITALNSKPSTIAWIGLGIAAAALVATSVFAFGLTASIGVALIIGAVAGTGGTVGGIIISAPGGQMMIPTLIWVDDFPNLGCADIKGLT